MDITAIPNSNPVTSDLPSNATVAMSNVVAEVAEDSSGGEVPSSDLNGSEDRRVKFHEDQKLTHEFDDSNLWIHDPNETAKDMISTYRRECSVNKVRPITRLLEQLERFDDLSIPIDTVDLKGVKLDSSSCEMLEVVLSRIHMNTLDLEKCNLEDEGAIALCEMVEFYGCASRVILSGNSRLRPRAWLTIGRMLKKSPFISMINVSYCALEEQTLTLLLRSVRANCALHTLKMEGNNLSGKGTFILMAAMKFNENLQEVWLGSNHLVVEDGQHLGSILRTNHTLKILDLRDNNLQDGGVRYICAGVAEQGEGLLSLNLTSNNIGQEGFHHVSAMLPCTKSLRDLNLSQNRCGDNGLFMLKLGLLANRSLEKLNLTNTKMTCEGAIALAEVLAESKHLTYIDIRENDIRVAGLMALQLAHRMNYFILGMQTPKTYRVEQRDRPLIKDLLTEIDKYCARNLAKKEERLETERRRQHEAQHAAAQRETSEEQGSFTAGGNQRNMVKPQVSVEEEEDEKEIDPSIVGALENVYPDEPGTEMESEEDPFKKVPAMDDHEKPSSLLDMERSMDAVVVYSEQGDEGETLPNEVSEESNLDDGSRGAAGLPDIVGTQSSAPPPDVTEQSSSHQTRPPPDLAVGAQRSVDLLDDTSSIEPTPTQPVDLTEGLDNS